MATTPTPQIPSSRVPLIDANGLVSREWYLFWYNLSLQLAALDARVTALEPP